MSENTESTQRKGFASPLQRAQAGRIGGGREPAEQERQDVTTLERLDVSTEGEADTTKKSTREETHFRQTVWMSKALNRRLKIHAAKTDNDVSGIINKLVEDYLDKMEDQ
ncbi:MAG: hypothetical protein H0U76_04070 [Ktedonobacteraceae bacterium]|nr:hypothetical protein [Ktedonobacteraceae bacterium]